MPNANVSVRLTANDLLSPRLLDIRKQLESIGAKASISLTSSQLLSGNYRAGLDTLRSVTKEVGSGTNPALGVMGTLLGSLGSAAILGGIGLVTEGFGKLTNSIADAAREQTRFIASSSDIASNLKIQLPEAKKLNEQLQVDIANIAASLPGTTSDYNQILQAVSGTVASQFPKDAKGFSTVATDITKRTGVLASVRGVHSGQAGSTINRFIAGTMGYGEALQNDIFQKNPQLTQAIQDVSKRLGVDVSRWKALQTSTRLAIVQAALKVATPDSLIAEFEGTVESIWQTWNTKLFDPQVGLLGMLRKVKSKGSRTVLDSVQGLMQALDSLSSKFNIRLDPLVPLISFIDWLADTTNGLHKFLSENKGTTKVGVVIGYVFNSLVKGLRDILKGNIVRDFIAGVAEVFWDTVKSIDYLELGRLLWDVLRQLVDGISTGINKVVEDVGRLVPGNSIDAPPSAVPNFPFATPELNKALGLDKRIPGLPEIAQPKQKGLPLTTPTTPGTTTNQQASTFAPQVSINGVAGSPQEIAQAVINSLGQMYSSYESQQLA